MAKYLLFIFAVIFTKQGKTSVFKIRKALHFFALFSRFFCKRFRVFKIQNPRKNRFLFSKRHPMAKKRNFCQQKTNRERN
jgi:hypothetical protein